MEETLSLPVNMPFDKRAVCTKSGHEPLLWYFILSSAGHSLQGFLQLTKDHLY